MRQPMIRIHQTALDLIGQVAHASRDGLETGGVLLGHDRDELVEITVAGDPGPAAVRQSTRFRRDLAHAQQLGDDAFEADGSVWLGEWHTHPMGLTTPSELDHRSYAEMLADPELGFTRFVCFIITSGDAAWTTPLLWPWVVYPGGVVHAADAQADADDDDSAVTEEGASRERHTEAKRKRRPTGR